MRRISATAGRYRLATVAALCCLLARAVTAQTQSSPIPATAASDVVARLHSALVDAAQLEAPEARYDVLLPVVRATHDLRFIAELSIRRQWRELDESERDAFVAAFEALSVATYAARFEGIGPDTFRLLKTEAIDEHRIEVGAEIVRPEGDNVPLDYLLQRDSDGWRIINIVADGVSDLALKRARYQQVFRDGGDIGDLIEDLIAEAEAL